MSTGLIEPIKHSPDNEKIHQGAKKAVKVDIQYILKEFPPGKIVTIFEHNGRQQNKHDHISYEILRISIIVLEKVSEVKGHQAYDNAHNNGDGSFLKIVELDKR